MTAPRYRGRFAPSPTGPLHFGSLVAALGSYCDARHAGGEWLLRIENVDVGRARPGWEAHIVATLARYGFAWDGEVVRQSERTDRYRAALHRLQRQGDVFACTCTRRALQQAPLGASGEPVYPGTCRMARREGQPGPHHAWRLDVQQAGIVEFVDRLQGKQVQDLARDVGDFVVLRSDGLFAYQLAVVIDDAEQGVTDVVRGADLLTSTARQIHLQRLLGVGTPSYLHLPVAINGAGEKLSKQTEAAPLPSDPLPALLAAWRFLDQARFPALPSSIQTFWDHAIRHWNPRRLPPVQMLPAPGLALDRAV